MTEPIGVYSKVADIQKRKQAAKTADRTQKQPTKRSTSQSTEIGKYAGLTIVPRPKAFYISTQVDEWLDRAARYFRKQGIQKADRSTIVNVLLHNKEIWKTQSLSKMKGKIVEVLASQLTSRPTS